MTRTKLMKLQSNAKTKRMIDEWDIVKCARCGRKISMLNATLIRNESAWVCNPHCKGTSYD